jgi:hypothetical protein
VTWSVDRTGSGNGYEVIASRAMSTVTGWTPDGSPFLNGADAKGKGGDSGACYQAYYFQARKFTPSTNNQLVTLVG